MVVVVWQVDLEQQPELQLVDISMPLEAGSTASPSVLALRQVPLALLFLAEVRAWGAPSRPPCCVVLAASLDRTVDQEGAVWC